MNSISKFLISRTSNCTVPLRYSKKAKQKLSDLLKNMQNEKPARVPTQKDKNKDKMKERVVRNSVSKSAPGTVNLQILGSGAPGSPASVYLFADQSRYLFNCGEGTQRLAYEHKIKLSRLEQIFITSRQWNRIGGLPGLCLTIQDAGVSNLNLNGPPDLDGLFASMRRFVILKDLTVTASPCIENQTYDDSVMHVKFVNLKGSSTNNSDFVISYICKLKPRPGALSLEKCVDRGVPPGPLLGQLKNGIDVTLSDGTIVKSSDVRAPDDPGPVFIFVDVPTEDYLDSLEACNHHFAPHQSSAATEADLALTVIHFTPQHIVNTSTYQDFINRFSPSTKHLILNDSNSFSGNVSAHRLQWQLNQLNSGIFPILSESNNVAHIDSPIESLEKKIKLDNTQIDLKDYLNKSLENGFGELVSPITYYYLRPRKGLDKSQISLLAPQEYLKETEVIPGFSESLQVLRGQYRDINYKSDDNEYPKILFLGTGSCMPNKTRNVSAILVHINKDSCILFDCGEGTAGQIIRFYGATKSKEVFKNLKAIYISHLHADHHIGLIGILQQKNRETKDTPCEKLLLFSPRQMYSWLNFYDTFIEPISDLYEAIPNDELVNDKLSRDKLNSLGLENIETCLVRHCPHSFGVSITATGSNKNLVKLTYSGDTMPCEDLVELGRNSTILIHEATMEDDLVDEAKLKMHSTVSQAITQGMKMEAKYILLTHFSQRYAKLPRLESSLESNVGIAFDNMQVTLNDLPHLHLLYPSLKLMFTEHCEEMEQKSMKRAHKLQRQNMIANDS